MTQSSLSRLFQRSPNANEINVQFAPFRLRDIVTGLYTRYLCLQGTFFCYLPSFLFLSSLFLLFLFFVQNKKSFLSQNHKANLSWFTIKLFFLWFFAQVDKHPSKKTESCLPPLSQVRRSSEHEVRREIHPLPTRKENAKRVEKRPGPLS